MITSVMVIFLSCFSHLIHYSHNSEFTLKNKITAWKSILNFNAWNYGDFRLEQLFNKKKKETDLSIAFKAIWFHYAFNGQLVSMHACILTERNRWFCIEHKNKTSLICDRLTFRYHDIGCNTFFVLFNFFCHNTFFKRIQHFLSFAFEL